MTKKYKNSPLTEVVAEFNFIPSSPWNITIPGLLYEKIKANFPDIKQRDGLIQIFTPPENSGKLGTAPKFDAVELVQFWNKSKKLLVQSGKDILTINALAPYPTWENFYPQVIEIFKAFCKLSKPKGLSRASLRYINTIQITSKTFTLEDIFQFNISRPKNLNHEPRYYNTHIEFNLNERDVLSQKIIQGFALNQKSKAIILDLEFIMNQFNGLQIREIENWLEAGHKIVNDTFENTVTEKLKETFE